MGSQKHIKIALWMEFLFNSSFSSRDTDYGVDCSSFQVCQPQHICLIFCRRDPPQNVPATLAIMYCSSKRLRVLRGVSGRSILQSRNNKDKLFPLRLQNCKSNLFSISKSMKPRLMILETPQITVIKSLLRMFPTKRMKIASL